MDVLLIHPPAAKPAEPPLGAAVLLAHLNGCGFRAELLDANLGAYLNLLDAERLGRAAGGAPSRTLARAIANTPRSLKLLRSPQGAASFSRYSTAVRHLNQALQAYCRNTDERLSLGDYQHGGLSEFAPADLERLAAGQARTLFCDYFLQSVLPRVEQLRPRLVALSVNYRHQVLPAFELAGLLRRHFPEIRVVAGGGMLTSWKKALGGLGLRFACFDHIVFGPGEETLARLSQGAVDPSQYLLEESRSIGFVPDYGSLCLEDYLGPVPVLPLSTSRGCYWSNCRFCPEATAPTHPYGSHAPTEIPDLLLGLAEKYQVSHFHLTDNAIPVPVLRSLAGRRRDLAGLAWHGFVRFEAALTDEALVGSLAEGGCRMLQLGLESGSARVLEQLGKGTDLAHVSQILKNLHQAGIASYVYVMLGSPGETEADAEQTLDFLERHAGQISYLNLAIMNLPRDSQWLDQPEGADIRSSALLGEEKPLGLYHSFEPAGGWGRREARKFLKQRLLASKPIRKIVHRTPPYFTSNHAFLFGREAFKT